MSFSTPCKKPELLATQAMHSTRRQALGSVAVWASLGLLGTGWAWTPNQAHAAARAALVHQGERLLPRGQGRLRLLGFDIYTARLWTAEDFEADRHADATLALELVYARAFSAQQLVDRSIQEMKRQPQYPPSMEAVFAQKLSAVLPAVKAGDRLVGLHHPLSGAVFQRHLPVATAHAETTGESTATPTAVRGDQAPLGVLDDPVLSGLFFGIWLSPATSQPQLRRALLGAQA